MACMQTRHLRHPSGRQVPHSFKAFEILGIDKLRQRFRALLVASRASRNHLTDISVRDRNVYFAV